MSQTYTDIYIYMISLDSYASQSTIHDFQNLGQCNLANAPPPKKKVMEVLLMKNICCAMHLLWIQHFTLVKPIKTISNTKMFVPAQHCSQIHCSFIPWHQTLWQKCFEINVLRPSLKTKRRRYSSKPLIGPQSPQDCSRARPGPLLVISPSCSTGHLEKSPPPFLLKTFPGRG